MQICPCRDCEDRKFLCHSSCERYQKWKDEYETVRDGLAEERAAWTIIQGESRRKLWGWMKRWKK